MGLPLAFLAGCFCSGYVKRDAPQMKNQHSEGIRTVLLQPSKTSGELVSETVDEPPSDLLFFLNPPSKARHFRITQSGNKTSDTKLETLGVKKEVIPMYSSILDDCIARLKKDYLTLNAGRFPLRLGQSTTLQPLSSEQIESELNKCSVRLEATKTDVALGRLVHFYFSEEIKSFVGTEANATYGKRNRRWRISRERFTSPFEYTVKYSENTTMRMDDLKIGRTFWVFLKAD